MKKTKKKKKLRTNITTDLAGTTKTSETSSFLPLYPS